VIHKKRGSTSMIITLESLDGFNFFTYLETGMNDAVDQWPIGLRPSVRTSGAHFEHTL